MHRTARCVLAALSSASLAACAGKAAAFRAGMPVDVEKKGIGNVYRQDGKPVDVGSLMAGLERVEASRADARSARGYTTGATVLGALGGARVGFGVVTGLGGEDSGWAIAAAGLGVTAIGLAVAVAGDRKLERAVGAYNAPLRSASVPAIAPWAGVAPGSQDRCVVGGIAVRF